MQRGNAAAFFQNQQKLIIDAKVLTNFLNSGQPVASQPMEILRLGGLHRKILSFDRDNLKKQSSQSDATQEELLQAINAYLELNEFGENVLQKFASSTCDEAKHLCEAVRFAIARKAYADEARMYLANLLDDIKTTKWEEKSASSSEEDSDEYEVQRTSIMPSQIRAIQNDIEDAARSMKTDADVVVILNKTQEAINKIRHQYDAHTDAAAFCRQHRDEIAALSYGSNQYSRIKINY